MPSASGTRRTARWPRRSGSADAVPPPRRSIPAALPPEAIPTLLATHMRELSGAMVFPDHHRASSTASGAATGSPWCRTSTTRPPRATCWSGRASPTSSMPSWSRTRSAGASLRPIIFERALGQRWASGRRRRSSSATAWISTWRARRRWACRRPGSTGPASSCPRARARRSSTSGTSESSRGSSRLRRCLQPIRERPRDRSGATRGHTRDGGDPASDRARRSGRTHAEGDHHRVRAGGLHRGHLRRAGQPGARHARGRAARRPARCSPRWSRTIPASSTASTARPSWTRFRKQAERFGTEIIADDVTAVDFGAAAVPRDRRRRHGLEAHTVIVATGASAKLLGLPGESKLMGRGVSTCATCDGFFFKDQNIMVVGGGDSALEEALYLSRLGRQGAGGASPGHAARLQDHAGARVQEPEDRLHLGHGGGGRARPRAGQGHGGAPQEPQDRRAVGGRGRRAVHRHRARAQHRHLPRPARRCIRTATSGWSRAPRAPRCPASSPPATSRTSPTARR